MRRGAFLSRAAPFVLVPLLGRSADAQSAAKVTVGTTNSNSDAPLFIGEAKGYFREQGIDVELIPFDAGAKMVAPLGTGQLDVAGGAPSAGLYNAIDRGIDLRIVADKGSTPKGYGYIQILVRKALIDSGKVKSVRDLRGLNVAEPAQGTASFCTLNEALKKGGLSYRDVNEVFLGFPDHLAAFAGGAIDASVTVEPVCTKAIEAGVAVKFMSPDDFYPNQQVACILYGGPFIKNKPELARKFMVAYIKSTRDYNDALRGGRMAGPLANEVVAILTKYTSIKDPNVYRAITPNGNDPNGRLNLNSLKKDLDTFKEAGLVKGPITVDQTVDTSFVESAIKQLGRYKPRKP